MFATQSAPNQIMKSSQLKEGVSLNERFGYSHQPIEQVSSQLHLIKSSDIQIVCFAIELGKFCLCSAACGELQIKFETWNDFSRSRLLFQLCLDCVTLSSTTSCF